MQAPGPSQTTLRQSLVLDVSEPHLRHDAERQSRESLMQEQGEDRADERRDGGELQRL